MQKRPCSNLSHSLWRMLDEMKRSRDHVTFVADKNLGIAEIETEAYDTKVWSKHLSDTTTYREVPSYFIHAKQVQLKYKIDAFTTAIQGKLPEHELIFFSRLRKQAYN